MRKVRGKETMRVPAKVIEKETPSGVAKVTEKETVSGVETVDLERLKGTLHALS